MAKEKKAPGYGRTWPGGIVWIDRHGRECYTILRQVDGVRYKIATRTHHLKAAMAHLERFERDPSAYRPGGDTSGAVRFTEELCERFLTWSLKEKRNTPEWCGKQKRYLEWWREQLGEVDLRTLSLTRDILPPLDQTPGQGQRAAVIKALYGWLRKQVHAITPAQDPTLNAMPVRHARPEQARRIKAFSPTDYSTIRAWLLERPELAIYGQALTVLAGTGWHVTELCRFAAGGELSEEGGEAVLDLPRTKAGTPLRTRVSPEVAAAARELRAGGKVDYHDLWRAVRKACRATGVKIAIGSFRHSVATWAINGGASVKDTSAFLNHGSEQTTRRFYATHAAPKKVPTLA